MCVMKDHPTRGTIVSAEQIESRPEKVDKNPLETKPSDLFGVIVLNSRIELETLTLILVYAP